MARWDLPHFGSYDPVRLYDLRPYRNEVLDAYVFESIEQVRAITEDWLREYNEERPHDSLGRVPPHTFLPRPTTAEQSPWELSA